MLMGVNGIGLLCIGADYMGIKRKWARNVSRYTIAVFMMAAGAAHFDPKMMDFYLSIMPQFLPYKRELIYLSGAVEILGGALSLLNATKNIGGYLIVATLLGVFPANIYMAVSEESQRAVGASQMQAYLRLPLQAIMIGMAAIFIDSKQEMVKQD